MAGELEGHDQRAQMRISDADRHRVAELLRNAAGDGRLDLEELDERLEATWSAKTYADLVPITADLPGAAARPAPVPTSNVPATRYDTSLAIMGGSSRRGVWEVGPTHTAFTLMGGVDIDLREAVLTSRETVINAYAIWGSVTVIVNAHARVVVDGVGIMGDFSQARDRVEPEIGPDSPVVRVTGFALMAGVVVQRRRMPGARKRRAIGRG